MNSLLLFIFATIGLTNMIVDGTIFRPLRQWAKDTNDYLHDLVTCHQCTGFWAGMLCGMIVISCNPSWVIVTGFAGSFLAPLYVTIYDYIISQTNFTIEENDE